MPGLPFLDTNVILRHTLQDHADHSPRATALMARIETGEITVRTLDTVIFETVFTLERTYKVPRPAIQAGILKLLSLPGSSCAARRAIAGPLHCTSAFRSSRLLIASRSRRWSGGG